MGTDILAQVMTKSLHYKVLTRVANVVGVLPLVNPESVIVEGTGSTATVSVRTLVPVLFDSPAVGAGSVPFPSGA